jgi:hypothetical protein
MFDLPIKGKSKLIVKFGEEFNNDNDELLILPNNGISNRHFTIPI